MPKVSQKVAASTPRASTDLFVYLSASVVFRLEVARSRQQIIIYTYYMLLFSRLALLEKIVIFDAF